MGCSTMIQIDLRVIISLVNAHSLNITHENVFQLVEVGSRCTIDTVASKLEVDYYFVSTWGNSRVSLHALQHSLNDLYPGSCASHACRQGMGGGYMKWHSYNVIEHCSSSYIPTSEMI